MAKKVQYSEPAGYIPEYIRKELKLGEYSPEADLGKDKPKKQRDAKAENEAFRDYVKNK